MIKINLLGKKKVAQMPFALETHFEKIGLTPSDVEELRPPFIRAVVVVVGLYVASAAITYIHEEKLKRISADFAVLTEKSAGLMKEITTKKDVRRQMDQLNKEEAELQRQFNAVSALQKGRTLAFSTLNDVTGQLEKSQKVWVEDMRFENRKFALTGKAWEDFPIYDFVKAIQESTRYAGVQLPTITSEPSKFANVKGVPENVLKIKKFHLDFLVKEAE